MPSATVVLLAEATLHLKPRARAVRRQTQNRKPLNLLGVGRLREYMSYRLNSYYPPS